LLLESQNRHPELLKSTTWCSLPRSRDVPDACREVRRRLSLGICVCAFSLLLLGFVVVVVLLRLVLQSFLNTRTRTHTIFSMMLSSTKESTANPKIPHYLNVCTESLRESKTQQKCGERKKERKKTSLAIVDDLVHDKLRRISRFNRGLEFG
jgi:hypothetical protein